MSIAFFQILLDIPLNSVTRQVPVGKRTVHPQTQAEKAKVRPRYILSVPGCSITKTFSFLSISSPRIQCMFYQKKLGSALPDERKIRKRANHKKALYFCSLLFTRHLMDFLPSETIREY